ncbi:putative short chain dehydrogenase [Escherichia coli]|uniref:Putative short chain dehydrogenase n=1 Tax=Escherichia coli TaxID=562 RepID=A0A2X1MZ53_ECOLX|nr:putative short chain dehydrogenase [Escherichia coli]
MVVLHNAGLLGDVCPMSEQNPQVWQESCRSTLMPPLCSPRHCFLYYSNRTPVHWSLLHQALDVRDEPNWGAYAASKFATEGMMQVLADEYQQRLRVNCINPGGTRTAMRASAFPTEDPQKLKTPADIMPLYLWLMGDDSRRKTGMTFDAQPGRKPGISQ